MQVNYVQAIASLLWVTIAAATPRCDHNPTDIESFNNATIGHLRRMNYTVVEGTFKVFNSSSFGANPGNPYVTYFHPGLIENRLPLFELSEQRAVLFLGCTPASPAYFSWRSYAFTSHGRLVFASLGDTMNDLVINTTSQTSQAGGHLTAVVTTADQGTWHDVAAAMQAAGVPRTAVNLDAVPSELLDMGGDPTLRFIMLHRASVWGDAEQEVAYFAQTRRIFFVDPPKGVSSQPIPLQPLRTSGDGVSEGSMPGITTGIASLRQAVLDTKARSGYSFVSETVVSDLGLDGFKCLKEGTNCKGDNRDTHYLQYHDAQLREADVYVMIGTNSVETGKCTYSNIGLYEVEHTLLLNRTKLTSTNLTVDDRQLKGSANNYGISNDKLFAYQISRGCTDEHHCLAVDLKNIPAKKEWAVAYRPYLEPSTRTGPKLSELVLPVVMKFTKSI